MLHGPPDPATLTQWVEDTNALSVALVADLSDEQMLGPRLAIVNPLIWETAHVAWFYEKWNLRDGGKGASILPRSDALYDSSSIAHDRRWDLPLPSRAETQQYIESVRDAVLNKIASHDLTTQETYFVMLAIFHADMHNEAFLYTRQTHGYPAPSLPGRLGDGASQEPGRSDGPVVEEDVEFPFGSFELGADHKGFFIFDNEKWAHEVNVHAFSMSKTAVSQGQFLGFVEDEGYARPELWSPEGRHWLQQTKAGAPLYWQRDDAGNWQRRIFDRWEALQPRCAMVHVNWFEAEAYCNWAGRRLPSEIEWEFAASTSPGGGHKRYFPWGDEATIAQRANLDMLHGDTVDVFDKSAGDSDWGIRQMIGNVWEWTASSFTPYPGFSPDPYKEYSEPWFDTHKALRGGAWPTRGRMLRNTWRSFYTPDRRDVWCGFRTCALAS